MKKRILIAALPVVGVLLVVASVFYDVLFAGIPYQDPTTGLQARYDFHSSVAGWFYKAGRIIFLAGALAEPVNMKKFKPATTETPLRDTSH